MQETIEKIGAQKEWLKTDEGKAYLATLEPYTDLKELYRDLSKIETIYYTTDEIAMEQAVEHSRKILTAFYKARNLDLRSEREHISTALCMMGCVKWNSAHGKFKVGARTLGESIFENNTVFPISFYTQLINTDAFTFDTCIADFMDGEEMSWVAEWLIARQMEAPQSSKEKM